jgi:hypothetical protein
LQKKVDFSIPNIYKCEKIHCVPPTENESSLKQLTARDIDGLTPSLSKIIKGTKTEHFSPMYSLTTYLYITIVI